MTLPRVVTIVPLLGLRLSDRGAAIARRRWRLHWIRNGPSLAVLLGLLLSSPSSGECDSPLDRHASLFPAGGGSVQVVIASESSCGWLSTTTPWMHVEISGDEHPRTATITCGPNLSGPRREGIVRIGGGNHRVIQAGGATGTVLCWGSGPVGQCDVPTDLDPVTAVAADEYATVALEVDGTVRRWGAFTAIPSDLRGVLSISARHAITDGGTVRSLTGQGVPSDLQGVVEVADGWLHSIALLADGSIRCWGDDSFGQCAVPPDLGPVLAVAGGRFSSAALLVDGTVREWGQTWGVTVPPDLPPVVRIAKGWEHTVADVGPFGLRVWGTAGWHGDALEGFSNDASPVRHLTAGRAATLVLDSRIHLWGTDPSPDAIDLASLGPPLDAAIGSSHGVVLVSSAACAMNRLPWQSATLPTSGGSTTLRFQRNGIDCELAPEVPSAEWLSIVAVVEDGPDLLVTVAAGPLPTEQRRFGVVKVGDLSIRVSQFPPTRGDWLMTGQSPSLQSAVEDLVEVIQVECGYTDFCLALRSDGTVIPLGTDGFGQASVPTDLGPVIDIAVGQAHVVALQKDGSVRCWGWNCCGQTDVPANLEPVIDVTAGFNSTAVILEDGRVRCWGSTDADPCVAPPDLADVVAIDGGVTHFLALKADGSVRGWGSNRAGQIDIPDDLGDVTAVAAGVVHSLALRTDGTVRSWGFGGSGETVVPPDLKEVVGIAAGGEPLQLRGYSVARLADGSLRTWGDDIHASISLPADLGPVTSVFAGFRDLVIHREVCRADLTQDGAVDGADISVILGFWGLTPGPFPEADITRDGVVDGADLAELLGRWGPCT